MTYYTYGISSGPQKDRIFQQEGRGGFLEVPFGSGFNFWGKQVEQFPSGNLINPHLPNPGNLKKAISPQ